MHKIAILHTVKSVYESFSTLLRPYLPKDTSIFEIVDEYLASDCTEAGHGHFTDTNKKRLELFIETARLTQADLLVVTCSTLSPYIRAMRSGADIPMVTIDEQMAKDAVAVGRSILVLATAESTVKPTVNLLSECARRARKQVDVVSRVDPLAIAALRASDTEEHDRRILAMADNCDEFDCIVLAQASMAHMGEAVAKSTGKTVLTSPQECIKEILIKMHL